MHSVAHMAACTRRPRPRREGVAAQAGGAERGGCAMGSCADDGVIDHRHRVFGYDGLYFVDGSAISAKPGVNPSLSICALVERAMTFIPEES